MGIFGKFGSTKNDIKVAKYEYKKAKLESKEKEKQAKLDEKTSKTQQLASNANSALEHTELNFEKISQKISNLCDDTSNLINRKEDLSGRKLSRDEKRELSDVENQVYDNLRYLYLTRDYFTYLTRLVSGATLTDEQLALIVKLNPYFDGVPVLDIEENEDSEDEDDSLFGAFKEIGMDFKEMFVSSKKVVGPFMLGEYVDDKYCDEIEENKIPDVETSLDSFSRAIERHSGEVFKKEEIKEESKPQEATITCPNCKAVLPADAKFCRQCGTKIEPPKPTFCMECGAQLNPGAKFCTKCGAKVNN